MALNGILELIWRCRFPASAALFVCLPGLAGAENPASEYAVKAAIVYKIAKFVSWPAPDQSARNGALSICLPVNDPITASIEALAGEKIHGRDILVQKLESLGKVAGECDIVYLSRPNVDKHRALLEALSEAPVLTIGDGRNFAKSGGIVALEVRQSRVQFAINVRASERAGLDISAQLLQLASIKN